MPKLPVVAGLACGAVIWAFSAAAATGTPNRAMRRSYAHAAQDRRAGGEQIRSFAGTIAKNGEEFVLNESATHKLYELDDQNAAARFANRNVTITGTLDTVKNIIRMQSIAEAAA